MESFLYLILIFIGGIFYRQRGGGFQFPFSLGTQGIRLLFWALPTSLLVFFLTWDWIYGLITFVSTFLSVAIIGHGAHQRSTEELLTNEPKDWSQTEVITRWLPIIYGKYENLAVPKKEVYHWAGMSFINITRLIMVIVPLVFLNLDPSYLAFSLLGFLPSYYIGWRIPKYTGINVKGFLAGGAEWGELLTGIVYWTAIIAACLYHTEK